MDEKLTCRLCTRKGRTHKDLLLENFGEIVKTIEKALHICIDTDSVFSHYICVSCYKKINDWNKFCHEIQEAQILWESLTQLKEEVAPAIEPIIPMELELKLDDDDKDTPVKDELEESDHTNDDFDCDLDTKPDESKPGTNSSEKRNPTKNKNRDQAINDFFDFTCPKCSINLNDWQLYRRHIEQNHSDTHPLTITCCATVIPLERRQLSNHVTYHTNPEKLQCGICGKQFRFIDKKTKHEKHHKNMIKSGGRTTEKEEISCGECGKVLGCRKSYNRHMRLHKSQEEREKLRVQCDLCKKIFVDRSNILTHMKDFHLPKETTVACDKCAKVFDSDKLFKAHYRRYHIEESRVTCPDCGMEMRASYLSVHRRSKHDTQAQICPLCSKEFKNRFTLNEHQRRIHSELKHECKVCGRMYTTGYKLKEHLEYHFTSNRFSCDQCDYINNVYSNMKKHRKVKHPNAPPIPEGLGRRFFEVK